MPPQTLDREAAADDAKAPDYMSPAMRILQLLTLRNAFAPDRAVTICEIAEGCDVSLDEIESHLRAIAMGGMAVLPVLNYTLFDSFQSYYIAQTPTVVDDAAGHLRAHSMALHEHREYLEFVADAMRHGVPVWECGKYPVAG